MITRGLRESTNIATEELNVEVEGRQNGGEKGSMSCGLQRGGFQNVHEQKSTSRKKGGNPPQEKKVRRMGVKRKIGKDLSRAD